MYKCAKPRAREAPDGYRYWLLSGQLLVQINGGYDIKVDFVYGVDSNNNIYTLPVNGIGNWRQNVPNVGAPPVPLVTVSGRDMKLLRPRDGSNTYRCKKNLCL